MPCKANLKLNDSLKPAHSRERWVFEGKIVSKTKACRLMGSEPIAHDKNISKIFEPSLYSENLLYICGM